MTKTHKITLLVALGIVFILAVALIAVGPTAFAATAEEPSGYYFKVGNQVVENDTIVLKRGHTTAEITYWLDGVQQPLLSIWTVATTSGAEYLTVNSNHTVTANANAMLTYPTDEKPFVMTMATNYIPVYLYFQIIPYENIDMYNTGAGPFTFTIKGIQIATINDIAENVNLFFSVTNSVGEIRSSRINVASSSEIIDLNGANFSGYFLSGNLTVDLIALTYSYGQQSITYLAEDYPQLFGQSPVSVSTYFTGGNGSAQDPYTVSNFKQLDYIRYTSRYDGTVGDYAISSHFKLINNIKINVSSSAGLFQTIDTQFKGTFDGNNYTIRNLYIYENTGDSNYGLFAKIAKTGVVKNLTMENVMVDIRTGSSLKIGSIAAINYGTISNCTVKSSTMYVNARESYVGGIVGNNVGGSIINCANYADIEVCGNVGGIVGVNSGKGAIEYCQNYGEIRLDMINENSNFYTGSAGGIVGLNTTNATIENCSNHGKIVYGGPKNSSSKIQPNMAQIVGWLQSGSQEANSCLTNAENPVDYSLLTSSQQKYCSSEAVGKDIND